MHAYRQFWSGVACIAIATCAVPQLANADAGPLWTDAQLAGFSDVIARGRVSRVGVAADPEVGALYTYVTLDVSEVVKGPVRTGPIVIKQLGGRSGSTALDIGGQPTFTAGEDVLVFLEVRPRDRTLSTTALWQGKFTILSTTGGEVVTRQDPGGPARGVFSGQTRSLNTWMPFLRREGALASVPDSAPINWAPQEASVATSDGSTNVSNVFSRDLKLRDQPIRLDAVSPSRAQLGVGDEQAIRRAAGFWTRIGAATLSLGGLDAA